MEETIGEYARRSKIVYAGLQKISKLPQNEENDLIGLKLNQAKTLLDHFRMTFREKYLDFVGSMWTWRVELDNLPTYDWSLLNRYALFRHSYLPDHLGQVGHGSHVPVYRLGNDRRGSFDSVGARNGSFGHVMEMKDVVKVSDPSDISSLSSFPDLPPFHLWLSKFEHHYATKEIKESNPNWANDVWCEILPELMSYLTEDDVEEAPVATMKEATDKMDEALVLMENARAMIDNAMAMMELAETKLS